MKCLLLLLFLLPDYQNPYKLLEKGTIFEDFTMQTPDGGTFHLKSVNTKYILIDFWASWCGPCRIDNKTLNRKFEKFRDEGFMIVSVSLDDNRQKWMDAIKKDQLEWIHVSDLKRWQNALALKYKIDVIPFNVLLDKNRKIIARDIRAGQLEGILKKLMPN